MTTDATKLNASVSHISMLHRPAFGAPRMHMDEAAASAPAAMPETFSSIREAADFLTAERTKKQTPAAGADADAGGDEDISPDADDNTEGAGDLELSDEDSDAGGDPDHVEDQDADPEDESLPPIERPKSWAKADDAEWKQLPRSLQEKIAAREDARDKAIRKSQNDAAEATRGSSAKEQAAEKAKADYEQKAREALAVLEREQQKNFADIKTVADLNALTDPNSPKFDPLRFVAWQAHQTELAATKQEVDKANKAKSDKEAKDWQDFRTKETAAALEHIPELADKVKGPKLMQKAVELLQEVGFEAADLGKFDKGEKLSLFDHRIQRILVDAIRFRDIQAAKKAAVTKQVPQVQRPGARQPAGNANTDRIKALQATFDRNPTLKNAAALHAAQAKPSRRRAA